MGTQVYQVAGGWQAEDAELVMACFGQTPQDAEARLEAARVRARAIEARWASIPEDDEELTAEDLAAIASAKEEIETGQSRRVPVSRGPQLA